MWSHVDPWFSNFVLRIIIGTEDFMGDEYVRLLDEIMIVFTNTDESINRLIDDILPSLEQKSRSRLT